VRRFEFHYGRAFGLRSDSGPHRSPSVGGNQSRAARSAVQNKDGGRGDGHFPAANHFHVYRQLLADQPHTSAVVSPAARNRLRENARDDDGFWQGTATAAAAPGNEHRGGGLDVLPGSVATRLCNGS